MKPLIPFFFLVLPLVSIAQDTFSIVAVDPETREIGSAAASCVEDVDTTDFVDWLTAIIPDRGGIMSQAFICVPNNNLDNAESLMASGSSPSEIISHLSVLSNDTCGDGLSPNHRQYGIVDLDGNGDPRSAGFTGNFNSDYAEDRQGANYSIQGNILSGVEVIDQMETNFLNTSGSLADKLMAALQGANFPGADSRCLSDGTSSKLAFLVVYKPDDTPEDPWLKLVVPSQAAGVEPIDVLQGLYDEALSTSDLAMEEPIRLFPNPVTDQLQVSLPNNARPLETIIYDAQGREVLKPVPSGTESGSFTINTSSLDGGIYFLKVKNLIGAKTLKFLKQ